MVYGPLHRYWSAMAQAFFMGKPQYTEENVPDMTGKTVIVTGSNTGVGKEVARILYTKNAKVYMMARSEEKTRKAMDEIISSEGKSSSNGSGELHFIPLDLSNLSSVRESAISFLRKESRLDILINNAGLMLPKQPAPLTKQGHEIQMGTNCLGPFLLTKLLTPILTATANGTSSSSNDEKEFEKETQHHQEDVRVIWTASSAVEANPIEPFMSHLPILATTAPEFLRYSQSKQGNFLHAAEFARRFRSSSKGSSGGIIKSLALNPGNLKTELLRGQEGTLMDWILHKFVLYPAVYGAYTELFAATSGEVTWERNGDVGGYVAPWGRFWNLHKSYIDATRPRGEEGGTGIAREFWEWSEEQVKDFAGEILV